MYVHLSKHQPVLIELLTFSNCLACYLYSINDILKSPILSKVVLNFLKYFYLRTYNKLSRKEWDSNPCAVLSA